MVNKRLQYMRGGDMEYTMERAALGVKEVMQYLSLSRAHLYRLLAQGAIPSFHIGRRRLVMKSDLDRYIKDIRTAENEGNG
jgi:excisionase family DNA binding protein